MADCDQLILRLGELRGKWGERLDQQLEGLVRGISYFPDPVCEVLEDFLVDLNIIIQEAVS